MKPTRASDSAWVASLQTKKLTTRLIRSLLPFTGFVASLTLQPESVGGSLSPYRIAIDQTTKAIDDRARSYRNLIVTVSALIVGSIGWAAVTRTFSPLIGLVLLFPICGFFFVLDGKLLNGWRSRLFEAWIKKDIDFRAFC